VNIQPTADPFALLWSLGYRNLVPIVPPGAPLSPRSVLSRRLAAGDDARGKCPGVKERDGLWRGLDFVRYQADETDLARWRAWGAGVGIVCRDDVRGIDADATDATLADAIRREVEAAVGRRPTRIGRSPKALYVVRVAGESPYQMFEFGPPGRKRDRVEILAGGKQFVAHGTHPGTQQPYYWPRPLVPYADLPIATAETLADLMERLRSILPDSGPVATQGAPAAVDQESLRGDPETVRRAVAATPNADEAFPTRESYRDYGYAIKAAMGPTREAEALDLFQTWCAEWRGPTGETNDPEIVAADWRRMKPPFRVGAPRLYALAREASGGAFDGHAAETRARHHETVVEPERVEPLFPEDPAEKNLLDLTGTPFDFPEPSEIEPEDFLYDTWLTRGYVSLIAAQTKVGKSIFMIAAALAMTSGRPLLGVQVDRKLTVRIWNGEDTRATMARRIVAAMKRHGLTREDIGDRLIVDSGRDMPIVMATQTRSGATTINRPLVEALTQSLVKQKVDALIVDPFVKVHQVSENDNTAIDAVAREWVQVAGRAGIGLALVHHSRKLNGLEASIDDARGASALSSAARAALVLARMSKREAKTLGRSKDYRSLFRIADAASNLAAAPGDDERWFEIQSVDLNNALFDESGRQIRKGDRVGVAVLSATRGGTEESERAPATPAAADREAAALATLACGLYKRDPRSRDEWAGAVVAIAFGLDLEDADDRARAGAIVTRLVREGKLVERSRPDKNRKLKTFLEVAGERDERNKLLREDDLFGRL
jgi:hypothetical protein